MIDHSGFNISNPTKSKHFYDKALAPIGYSMMLQVPLEYTDGKAVMGYGQPPKPDFWIAEGTPNHPHIHIAFTAQNRKQVDAFYVAAMEAGGKDNGAPGLRPQYHKDYYAAFVLDPDGHNIEVVCHDPEGGKA